MTYNKRTNKLNTNVSSSQLEKETDRKTEGDLQKDIRWKYIFFQSRLRKWLATIFLSCIALLWLSKKIPLN